jgi:hypothetical protein
MLVVGLPPTGSSDSLQLLPPDGIFVHPGFPAKRCQYGPLSSLYTTSCHEIASLWHRLWTIYLLSPQTPLRHHSVRAAGARAVLYRVPDVTPCALAAIHPASKCAQMIAF